MLSKAQISTVTTSQEKRRKHEASEDEMSNSMHPVLVNGFGFLCEEKGATAIEYALLAALIAVFCIGAF
jgi:hypothetical protein